MNQRMSDWTLGHSLETPHPPDTRQQPQLPKSPTLCFGCLKVSTSRKDPYYDGTFGPLAKRVNTIAFPSPISLTASFLARNLLGLDHLTSQPTSLVFAILQGKNTGMGCGFD